MSTVMLGCIADDLTGATDLANNLVRAGMRVLLTIDVPSNDVASEVDAVVVAFKSRTIPSHEAVAQSLAACRWLQKQGTTQIYFKICSTFDSTPEGNIGPVIEALMDELGCDFSTVVPAFPENGRTVYQGHLFVGNVLLSDNGMRHHPLTPMTDANLVRFLGLQMKGAKPRKIGLIDHQVIAASADSILERIRELHREGVSIAIADSIDGSDLEQLAIALQDAPLITASSGLAAHMPSRTGVHPSPGASYLPLASGFRAIVSGSCSVATNEQVRQFIEGGGEAFPLDIAEIARDKDTLLSKILDWADAFWTRNPRLPLLVYSTAAPDAVKATHSQFGVERSGEIIEAALSEITRGFVQRGAGQLIVAGGETSGICARALNIEQMRIGPQIDPGVPWCYSSPGFITDRGLHIALKSGNFGKEDFFSKAFALLN